MLFSDVCEEAEGYQKMTGSDVQYEIQYHVKQDKVQNDSKPSTSSSENEYNECMRERERERERT